MPFDGVSAGLTTDLVLLRTALEGVRSQWTKGAINRSTGSHCAIGWLLQATDGDKDAAVRLALQYVYPALPPTRRDPTDRIWSIAKFNDAVGRKRVEQLFNDAIGLAEARAAV